MLRYRQWGFTEFTSNPILSLFKSCSVPTPSLLTLTLIYLKVNNLYVLTLCPKVHNTTVWYFTNICKSFVREDTLVLSNDL